MSADLKASPVLIDTESVITTGGCSKNIPNIIYNFIFSPSSYNLAKKGTNILKHLISIFNFKFWFPNYCVEIVFL